MTLIGDLGGFNGAIMLITTILMSSYSKSMFESSLEQETQYGEPMRESNKPNQGLKQDEDLESIGMKL